MPLPTIIIADDDVAMVHLIRTTLSALRAEILVAHDALSALLMIHNRPPDLVILDVNMPAGNGMGVCEMLASDPTLAHIPVIIFTGQGTHARVRSLSLGAHYIQKGADALGKVARLAAQIISDARCESTKSQLFIG
jgi:DNA-binding response OmpR family regulator